MPSDILVEFEDGSTHTYKNAPDNVTREQVVSRAMKQFGKKVKPLAEPMSPLKREAARVVSDIAKGAGSMGALAIDANAPQGQAAVDIAQAMIPRDGNILPDFFSPGKKVQNQPLEFGASKALQSLGPEATTVREKLQSVGTQGAVGGFINPFGALSATALAAPKIAAVTGASAGVGAELAAGQEGGLLSRLIGGVLGGWIGNKGARIAVGDRRQAVKIAKDAVEGLSPEAVAKATEVQAMAKAQGVDMDIAQALEAAGAPSSNVTTLRNVIANSTSGDKVQANLRQQPLQLERLATVTEASIPGPVVTRNAAANQVTKAATERLEEAKAARTAAVRADYAKAKNVPGIWNLVSTIDRKLKEPGTSEALRSTGLDLRQKLVQLNKKNPYGVPALDVDVALSDAMGAYKGSPTYLTDPRGTGQVKRLGAELNKQFQTLSPEVAAAEAKYAKISKEVVNPLKQGPVGQIAGRAGYLDDKQSPAGALESIFKRGSDPQVKTSSRDIPILIKELRKVDKEAVPGAVKEFVRNRLNSAFESAPGSTVNAPIGARESANAVYTNLFKTDAQWQGMRDMVAGSAYSMGMNAKEVAATVKGMDNFAQIAKGLRNTSATDGTNWKDIAKMGGRSYLADTARAFSFLPFNRLAERVEEVTLSKTFRQFDEVLTSPNGLKMLQELAQVSPKSGKALAIMSTFGGTLPNAMNDNPGE
jgi:hypothetical protein